MNKRLLVRAAAAAAVMATAAPAVSADLSNGSADGQVTVSVGGTGSFSSGLYNPVGAGGRADTVYASTNYIRVGGSGSRIDLASFGASVGASSATNLESTFSGLGLRFALSQTLTSTVTGGVQTGSLLAQTYTITNTTGGALDFDMVRYLDGDLQFNGSLVDGGGSLMSNGNQILFETDTATGAADGATFLGIYSLGGAATGYGIDAYSALRSRIAAGSALGDFITGDHDNDGFIDAGAGYDVALGLSRAFSLAAGATTTYTTYTIFGTGAPQDVVLPGGVPEPATWAMMLIGFGGLGAALRRRTAAAAA